jgi:YkoY family integral membrane protein
MDVTFYDFLTVGLLVVLEALLSADNALVMAVMVLGLRREDQQKALRYGLIGAFAFRILATLLAAHLIQIGFVKLFGGLYLLYLAHHHFFQSGSAEERSRPKSAKPWLGLSPLWATVVKVELVNLAFSIDSILVAVAMSPKLWVILTGGLLGIVAMRLVVGQLLTIVRRYPSIVDGAFIIIAWIGLKLLIEYLHATGLIHFEIDKWISFGLIAVIFVIAYLQARRKGPVEQHTTANEDEAEALLRE